MSQQIDAHIVQAFRDGIQQLQQDKGTRLRSCVDVDPKVVGDRAYYNQLGATHTTRRTTRHGDTQYTDTPHSRRMVSLATDDVADLLDTDDSVQILTDPTNSYSQAFAMAMGRTQDNTIVDAFTATSATGKEGTGTESFPTGTHQVAHGSEGMTISKLLDAKEILDSYEVEDEERYGCMSAKQFRNLLATTEVTNADYNTVKALVNGQIDSFLGFTFKRLERLPVASSIRSCMFWHKMSMKLAIGINPRGRVSEMPNKNYSIQVFYEGRFGATRMDGVGVVEVLCDES
jgi:hypothetical protein